MKQSHTMYIYKTDRRTKTGERLVSTTVWQNRDAAEMKREVRELQYELWPTSKGFRIETVPNSKQNADNALQNFTRDFFSEAGFSVATRIDEFELNA